MRGYIDQLRGTDYPDLATNAAVEFINMMVAIECLPAAARVFDDLAAAGDFGALAARALVVDAATRIAADAELVAEQGRPAHPALNARQLLLFMRDVLDGFDEADRAAE